MVLRASGCSLDNDKSFLCIKTANHIRCLSHSILKVHLSGQWQNKEMWTLHGNMKLSYDFKISTKRIFKEPPSAPTSQQEFKKRQNEPLYVLICPYNGLLILQTRHTPDVISGPDVKPHLSLPHEVRHFKVITSFDRTLRPSHARQTTLENRPRGVHRSVVKGMIGLVDAAEERIRTRGFWEHEFKVKCELDDR